VHFFLWFLYVAYLESQFFWMLCWKFIFQKNFPTTKNKKDVNAKWKMIKLIIIRHRVINISFSSHFFLLLLFPECILPSANVIHSFTGGWGQCVLKKYANKSKSHKLFLKIYLLPLQSWHSIWTVVRSVLWSQFIS
jgi:hypothetical protein